MKGEATRTRDAFMKGRARIGPGDIEKGYDFLDAEDVDGDARDLFDRDNIRVTLKNGDVRYGNRVSVDAGRLSLWKGLRKDQLVLDGASVGDVKEVRRGVADGRIDGAYDAAWWGHCNAWGMAALLFKKPEQAVTVDGVGFTVRDQKGLLVELGMGSSEDSTFSWDQLGHEIDPRRYTAAFHAQLVHWLRREEKGLLADMELKDKELGPWPVWNYPLMGYEAKLVEADGDDPGVLDADVKLEVASYSDDDRSSSRLITYRLHFANGEVRDDASAKTDWTSHVVIGGEQRRGYVRYLIHPYRLTGRGSSGNPVVTEERVAKVIPSVKEGGR